MGLLEREPHASDEVERLAVLARELDAAGAVEHRELLGDDVLGAVVLDVRAAHRLRATSGRRGWRRCAARARRRPGRGSRSRPSCRARGSRCAGTRARRATSRCPARPWARRRTARCGEFASPAAIATRCCSPPDISPGRRSAQYADPEHRRAARRSAASRSRAGAPGEHRAGRRRSPRPSGTARGCGRSAATRSPTIERRYSTRCRAVIVMRSHDPTRTRPAVGTSRPGEHGQQGRLARAGGADDRHQLAGLDEQVQALQRLHLDRPRTGRCARASRTRSARAHRSRRCALGRAPRASRVSSSSCALPRRSHLIVRPPAAPRPAGRAAGSHPRPARPRRARR